MKSKERQEELPITPLTKKGMLNKFEEVAREINPHVNYPIIGLSNCLEIARRRAKIKLGEKWTIRRTDELL